MLTFDVGHKLKVMKIQVLSFNSKCSGILGGWRKRHYGPAAGFSCIFLDVERLSRFLRNRWQAPLPKKLT